MDVPSSACQCSAVWGGYLLHCWGCFFFGGRNSSVGVWCLGRRGGMPMDHPSIWLEETGLGQRLLGYSDTESKKVKPWGHGSCLVAWPKGWMLGTITPSWLQLWGVQVDSPKRAAFNSHQSYPSPRATPGICVTALGSVWQGPDLPCRGNAGVCAPLQKQRETPLCSLARLEPACFYWEQLG